MLWTLSCREDEGRYAVGFDVQVKKEIVRIAQEMQDSVQGRDAALRHDYINHIRSYLQMRVAGTRKCCEIRGLVRCVSRGWEARSEAGKIYRRKLHGFVSGPRQSPSRSVSSATRFRQCETRLPANLTSSFHKCTETYIQNDSV